MRGNDDMKITNRGDLSPQEIARQEQKPKHKNKTFKTQKAFDAWLERTGKYVVDFKDNGQDCLTWHLSQGGEVIHANLQSGVWCGMMVDLSCLKVRRGIRTFKDDMKTQIWDFIIRKITKNDL